MKFKRLRIQNEKELCQEAMDYKREILNHPPLYRTRCIALGKDSDPHALQHVLFGLLSSVFSCKEEELAFGIFDFVKESLIQVFTFAGRLKVY